MSDNTKQVLSVTIENDFAVHALRHSWMVHNVWRSRLGIEDRGSFCPDRVAELLALIVLPK
jgi:hypothetical protein